jgi:hypothetical protein
VTLPELDWSRKRLVSKDDQPPHPAPEVSARRAVDGEIPTGARRLAKLAADAGWDVEPTYARGTTIDRHGRPGGLIHSLAVRMRFPGTGYRAVAVWTSPAASDGSMKWKADGAYVWSLGGLALRIPLTAPKGSTVATLKRHLEGNND